MTALECEEVIRGAMSFRCPEFPEPIAIDPGRSWTAVFESYDQRLDDTYYIVTVHEAQGASMRFMACVGLFWAGDDWTDPRFLPRLRGALHEIAATGKTNTSYTGPLLTAAPPT